MQLASVSSKQIRQSCPDMQAFGALRELDGSDAYLVLLCALLKTTWASQSFGQDAPSL
jgi:hypothetical protein